MAPPRKDKTGMRFGLLTVQEYLENGYYKCMCECGNTHVVHTSNLNNGGTMSCGCLARKASHDRLVKHGMCDTRLYRVWAGMKARCNRVNSKDYPRYGGRGIRVCDEWLDFQAFFNWAMANGYDPNAKKGECTIDRIDVDGDYSPNNCRWVNSSVQQQNKRHFIAPSKWKPVQQVDHNGNVIASYESIKAAAKHTGFSTSGIGDVCAGRNKSIYGTFWRYANT